ncbi:MAG TPA: glutamate synthase-related protein, partial [Steroidobacteraceae bacterium]|nr:glutamate synthase-related protein [Steroidobacteraceae bacterium]
LRYTLSTDGLVIAGSEAGLADIEDSRVLERQRLGPGEMLLVDAREGRIYRNGELSGTLACPARPAARRPPVTVLPSSEGEEAPARQFVAQDAQAQDWKRVAAAYGWTDDQYRLLFQPLGSEGKEPVWSMGDDAPPAFLSTTRRPLWDYCKQRFAQVTNPPIDPLRESHVMSLEARLGRRALLPSPVANAAQMGRLRREVFPHLRAVDFTFEAGRGVSAARAALARVCGAACEAAARDGVVLLSDRGVSERRAALPALLATATAWKAIVDAGLSEAPLLVESGQVIETHHVALLVAAGASAAHPFLALELAERMSAGGADRYCQAVEAGLRKVLARMGISCLSSYRNSQLFETVGIARSLCSEYFEDAHAVFGSKTLAGFLGDSVARHREVFSSERAGLHDAGLYRFRQGGEKHASSPEVVRLLHRYIAAPTAENYRTFADAAAQREPVSVRDLLELAPGEPLPLGEVEEEAEILARFSTQAMSLGALSPEAHRTVAVAMNRLGARSNTGEGGEDPDSYVNDPEAVNRVKQVASARFGVTTTYLVHAHELEIKMAQGSKPGEGGQIPGHKVSPMIAKLRRSTPGVMLISPPPHHDIYSIEDLAQLIYDLKQVNPRAKVCVKLVAEAGVGTIAAGVAKAYADIVLISGHDGGTGASPLSSVKNAGGPWELGLAEAHQVLLLNGLRNRVTLRTDGGMKTGLDILMAAMLGAEEFNFGTAALIAT